ncbi:MAG: metalloregulator ArsR/SmtB family transcription factor [Cyclobacteriaceae bacterium]
MKLKNFSLPFGVQIFKSFSDESRVRIMSLLYRNEELCISDLELILDFTQTKTSRHITYLKNAGLLGFRKQDQWVFYHIKEEVHDIVDRIFKFLNKDPVLLNDYQTFETLNSNRELSINKIRLTY